MLDDSSDSDYNCTSDFDIADDDAFDKSASMEGAFKGPKSPFGLPHKVQEAKLKMSHQEAKKALSPRLQIAVGCMARTVDGQMGQVTKVSGHKDVRRKQVTISVNGVAKKCRFNMAFAIHPANSMVKNKRTGQWLKVTETNDCLVLQGINVDNAAASTEKSAAASTEKSVAASTEKNAEDSTGDSAFFV